MAAPRRKPQGAAPGNSHTTGLPKRDHGGAKPPPQPTYGIPARQTITERASKAEILSAAAELTDSQADRIATLQQRQTILLAVLAVLAALQIL